MTRPFDGGMVLGKDRKTFAKVFPVEITIVLSTNAVWLLAFFWVVGNVPNIFVKRF
jgi:hypothetical protein